MTFDTYRLRRHALPALAAALALGAGVALIATSGSGGARARPARATTTMPASGQPSDTPAGAVAAATAWIVDIDRAFYYGGWDRVMGARAIDAYRVRVERESEVSDYLRGRIAAFHSPWVARLWPLAYQVLAYSPRTARVRVWLYWAFAISASPKYAAEFGSVDVSLQWTGGDWKTAAQSNGPNLDPPGPATTDGQVTNWVNAISQLQGYQYVP